MKDKVTKTIPLRQFCVKYEDHNNMALIIFKVNGWIESTQPSCPSLVVMYWKAERGRHQLVWTGIFSIIDNLHLDYHNSIIIMHIHCYYE